MKKFTILLILTLSTFFSFGQWQILGSDIYYNTGKVGIGIKSAEVKLHVKDTIDNALIRIESKNKQGGLQIISNGSYNPFMNFGIDGVPGTKGGIYSDIENNQMVFRANKDYSESVELVLQDNGNVGIGKKMPAYKLDIAGDVNFTGNIYKEGQLFQSENLWLTNGSDIYYNTGKVGIGIKNAEVKLHVKDTTDNAVIRIESKDKQGGLQIISNGSYKPFINFGIDGVPGTKGAIYSDIENNQMVFRANKDYSEGVELILQDNGNLGIGKKMPAYKLDIAGDINFTGNIYKEGQLFQSENFWLANGNDIYYNSGKVGIGIKSAEVKLHVKDTIDNALIRIESKNKQGGLQIISNGSYNPFMNFGVDGVAGSKGGIYFDVVNNQIAFRANKDYSESVELVLQDNGNVGIGTKSPKAKLEISEGDIYISDIEKGIIMKSPDGKCWRGILDNSGNLTFNPIECPSESVTNLNSIETQQSIIIYPNPTENVLTIIFTESTNQYIDAEIYDMAGKMIFMSNYNSSEFNINTTDFKSGAYIIKLKNTNGELLKSEKIIKQ